MRDKNRMREVLGTAQLRARRKMLEIRSMLVSDTGDALSAADLAKQVRQQLGSLPPGRRRSLRAKIALAVNELKRLDDDLSGHFNAVRNELQRISRHRSAAIAYGHWSKTAPRHLRRHRGTGGRDGTRS